MDRLQAVGPVLANQVEHVLLTIVGQPVEYSLKSALALALNKGKGLLLWNFYDLVFGLLVVAHDHHLLFVEAHCHHEVLAVYVADAHQLDIVV